MEKKKKKKRLSLFVDSQLVDTGVEGNAAILIYLTQTCQWGVLITVMVIIPLFLMGIGVRFVSLSTKRNLI